MPARRQHRRGDGLTRQQRKAVQHTERLEVACVWRPDMDAEWAEHQAWERERRRPRTPEEIEFAVQRLREQIEARERMWVEFLRARDAVLADFARWGHHRPT